MSDNDSQKTVAGRPHVAVIAALALIALALGVSNLSLRRTLTEAEASLDQVNQRLDSLEEDADRRTAEAQAAAERSAEARAEMENALSRAAQAARDASTADDLAASLRARAGDADERAELALGEMRKAVSRAEAAEAELAEARTRLNSILDRLQAAEDARSEAEVQLSLMRQSADRSGADASAVRDELEVARAGYISGLNQARQAVNDALKRHEHAVAIGRQAEAAVELAFRDFYDPSDAGRRPLEDFRSLQRRISDSDTDLRKQLQQAADRLESLARSM